MGNAGRLVLSVVICAVVVPCAVAVSRRVIYTLFSAQKTWNEAEQICESQFGRIWRAKEFQFAELEFLDQTTFSGQISQIIGNGIWTGVHDPNGTYPQNFVDSHCASADITPTGLATGSTPDQCTTINSFSLSLTKTKCDNQYPFVCQRYEGDCWYAPFQDKTVEQSDYTETLTNVDPTDCAFECRNRTMPTGDQCWALTYRIMTGICDLHFLKVAQTPYPSSYYLQEANHEDAAYTVLYVRNCFEGTLDTNAYPDVSSKETVPLSGCALNGPTADINMADICFCTATIQPPIPEPISTAAKVDELIKELTIDTANTSAALRKKSSANDDRPSAKGVGSVGIVMLSVVFGGLLILDMHVAIEAVQKFVSMFRSSPPTTPPDEAPTTESG